jgi:tetratricopeptide (TPR) repeat protein
VSEVEKILARRYPSHHPLLAIAWGWARQGGDDLRHAIELLTQLRQRNRYRYVLALWQELAFALKQAGEREDALRLLGELEAEFPTLDEETLCRWGGLFKQDGHEALRGTGGATVAERCYQNALEKYERAYQLRRDPYPGINVATLWFLRAGLARELGRTTEAADDQARARAVARELLADRSRWPKRLPDDNIWMPATEAEAALFLERWGEAAEL